MDDIGVCVICGKEFVRGKFQNSMKYCGKECQKVVINARSRRFRELNKERINKQRREAKKKGKIKSSSSDGKMSVAEIEMLALEEGLSYGKYVAKYGV